MSLFSVYCGGLAGRRRHALLHAAGKPVATGFTNSEEEAVQLTEIVPFLVEDMLQETGAKYQKGADWLPFAVVDGHLITGQNPASSELVAEKLLAMLAE